MNNAGMRIYCPKCGKTASLSAWNKKTQQQCVTSEQRRAYIHLYNEKAFDKETDTYYMCPKCSSWTDGYRLNPNASDDIKLGLDNTDGYIGDSDLSEYINEDDYK